MSDDEPVAGSTDGADDEPAAGSTDGADDEPAASSTHGADDEAGTTDHRGDADERTPRHERVHSYATQGPLNSLQYWTNAKSPVRVALNYAIIWVVRISPSLRLKNWLLRRIGVTVGAGVSWGLEATPDVFWPEHITLRDHAIVGYDATLLCHEFLQDEYRVGDVVVGERAMIGAGAIVLPGVEIGDGAQVAANSLVTRDVPPGTTVAGVPARPMRDADVHSRPDDD